jgi:hypothetical protein
MACYSRGNPLRFERLYGACVVPIRREVEWRCMRDEEKVLEDLYRADKDFPWERRSWKVAYEHTTHTSGALTFERHVQPVEYSERRWNWTEECLHNLILPRETDKYGPIPWGAEVWVYHKLNFLLEEVYQAALETVSIRVGFRGISDTVPGCNSPIPDRGQALANGHDARFWYSRRTIEHQPSCHDRPLGGALSCSLYRGVHRR